VGFTKRKPAVFSFFFFFFPCDTHWVSSGYPPVVMGFFVGKNCGIIVICKAQGASILWESGPCLALLHRPLTPIKPACLVYGLSRQAFSVGFMQ
jgi:hypothetical protein